MIRYRSLAGATLAFILSVCAWPAAAQDPPKPQDPPKQEDKKTDAEAVDVSGSWDLTVEMQQGPLTVGVTFKVDKEKLTGTIKGPQGDLEVAGTVSATELAFGGTVQTNNGEIKIAFTGAPGKEKMTGTFDFGGRGTGNWSATRTKPQ